MSPFGPPRRTSPPAFPSMMSNPSPPSTTSAPMPAITVSFPAPAAIESAPPRPLMKSLPERAQITSGSGVPINSSFPVVPPMVQSPRAGLAWSAPAAVGDANTAIASSPTEVMNSLRMVRTSSSQGARTLRNAPGRGKPMLALTRDF
jgi:hypothetical protein